MHIPHRLRAATVPALALVVGLAACTAPIANHNTPAAAAEPYTASGNEPGWHLAIGAEQLQLAWAYGEHRLTLPTPPASDDANGRHYRVTHDGHSIQIDIRHALCHDDMTGMPYPDQVRLRMDGGQLRGCGGQPASLLTGNTWIVEDINGGGIIDFSRLTLVFTADGQLSGHASCNHYSGQYKLTGEGLHIDTLASTEKACAPALNQQEQRLLEVLRHATRFDFDSHGKLVIHAGPDKTLTAVRD